VSKVAKLSLGSSSNLSEGRNKINACNSKGEYKVKMEKVACD